MRTIRGNQIGMIFQEPMTSLNPVFTVGRQLTEGLRVHKKLSKQDAEERAVELLRRVRMPEPERRLTQYPHELSGGMRQRVMIAMALACEPQLLIADEPTTALDVTIQAEILSLINRRKRETGTAVMFITHDMAVVAQMADRVVVMYRGKQVEEGHGHGHLSKTPNRTIHPCPAGSGAETGRDDVARNPCRNRWRAMGEASTKDPRFDPSIAGTEMCR